MTGRELLKSPSFLIMLAFCGLSIAAARINSPWWEGKLLSIQPEMPPGFERHQPLISFAHSEDEPDVVDLSALQAMSDTLGAEAEPDTQTNDRSSDDAHGTTDHANTHGSTQTDAPPSFSPDPRDVALLDAMRRATASTQNQPSLLTIPCRDLRDPSGASAPRDTDAADHGADDNVPSSPIDAGPECQRYALDAFFSSLRQRALGTPGLTRWSHYGDSLVVGDSLTGELRRLLQRQFGDGGHGFIYIGQPLRQFGFENIRVSTSEAWQTRTIVRHSEASGDMFGFGGAEFRATKDSSITIQNERGDSPPRPLEHFHILYFAPPGVTEGSVHVSIDGDGRTVRFTTAAGSSGVQSIHVPPGEHRVVLSNFSPALRWYGVISETSGPGVVVDNVGQVSARADHLLKINAAQWQAQLALRNPDLVAFFYGVNAASSSVRSVGDENGTFAENYREILRRATEGAPHRDCLVMSLLTRGTREGGEIHPTPAVRSIHEAQRAAAASSGCAFFDTTAVMGGANGIQRWADRQLLGADLAHPTPAGYRELARKLHADILRGFVEYLDRRVAGHYEQNEPPKAPLALAEANTNAATRQALDAATSAEGPARPSDEAPAARDTEDAP